MNFAVSKAFNKEKTNSTDILSKIISSTRLILFDIEQGSNTDMSVVVFSTFTYLKRLMTFQEEGSDRRTDISTLFTTSINILLEMYPA